jgi:ACS family hexuronate transporter-like MFS transporter
MGRQILEPVSATPQTRSASWKWWVCGLLLFASMINYMDRQTLANAATRITTQFGLNQEQYGNLELVFGWAFAVGSVLFGVMVDRLSVRWVYPAVLVLWSATGFATGFVQSYDGLLICRTLLGLFEAGHWPCAIKTTQRLLAPKDRAMGNSLLQSGASVGAILTPLVMRAMLSPELGSWRFAFQVIGAIGVVWIIFWFAMVRETDVAPPAATPQPEAGSPNPAASWRVLLSRRMLVVLFVVACINTCWQTLRAWLPKFLMEGRGYAEPDALYFNSVFYIATDVGCLGAGALTLWLARRGMSVHRSRLLVFGSCAMLTALTTLVAALPKGWPLLAALLVVGAGALGVFPVYHALTQELSPHHQGTVTGLAGVAAWAFSSPAQKFFGRLIDQTGSFDLGFALVGWLPLLAFVPLWLLWDKPKRND